MDATLTGGGAARKHMFGTSLDSERTFAHDAAMHRTYVRRRLLALALALAAVALLSGRIASAVGADPVELAATRAYVVRTGDSLWSIAADIAPQRDPRIVVHELVSLNPTLGDELVPGAVVELP
jgi:LysM domain